MKMSGMMCPKAGMLCAMAAVAGLVASCAAADVISEIRVDTRRILRDQADRFVGINLNYIRDDNSNRPDAPPLASALRDLGVRWLRYPGGEKSDFCLWSRPPYSSPDPVSIGSYADFPGIRMDFDRFISTARAAGAEPYVVVGFDSFKRTGRTEDDWLRDAVALVRYANVTRKYGVTYWEIGNENWSNRTTTPIEMARVVGRFSRAMKEVDPSIRVGSNGSGENWWAEFLPAASRDLDFISLSLYNAGDWSGYEHWLRNPEENLIHPAQVASAAIFRYARPADRARIRVVVDEINAVNWKKTGWDRTNSIGHALVIFDTIGRLLNEPRVLAGIVWGTRWMDDREAARNVFYALGPSNEIMPTGRAIELWGRFLRQRIVASAGGGELVSSYASTSSDSQSLMVWILNRGLYPAHDLSIAVTSPVRYARARAVCFSGKGPDDISPTWSEADNYGVEGNRLAGLTAPGTSVTVVEFSP
ncbi:MAG: hypothetical protein D4R65_01965 [Verrucomicrobiaceae bacterium]|nr:MAG: hypothetical protein D4R65_01965 [Verrucomicrobiaceae bacterium]